MDSIKPNILVIESASSVMRISVSGRDNKIWSAENADRFSHAENVIGLVERVLNESAIPLKGLDGIIISKGPGSFTGLRIGLATAKGLALANNIPLAAISVFEAVQSRLRDISKKTAVLIPSRRDEYYLTLLSDRPFDERDVEVIRSEQLREKIGKTRVLPIDINPEILPFPGRQIIRQDRFRIEAQDYITAGRQTIENGGVNLEQLEPLYIQPFPAVRKT